MATGLIYKHTNKVNGKSYVGMTTRGFRKRWLEHIAEATRNAVPNSLFHKSIRKYGADSFVGEILEDNIDESDLQEREIYFINKEKTFECGYNLTFGGEGVNRGIGENSHRYGVVLSYETKKKISKSHIGKTLSNETKKKIGEASKGTKNDTFRPWYIIDSDGTMTEFHDITIKDYAIANNIVVSTLTYRFSSKCKHKVAKKGMFKGMKFGHINLEKVA